MRTVAGRYLLEERLGVGGMGEVYRARHLQLGKQFALKIIAPAFAADAASRTLFEREVKLASEIRHPNIVSVVDYGEDDQVGAFMVMELVDGDPLLHEYRIAPMPIRRALDILGQVADALDHIHRRGIVHGDIKADNIMIADEVAHGATARRRRIVQLLDFGLARRISKPEFEVSGSPHYLAPERALGDPASVASDIYALGVLAFLMFTNTLPFEGETLDVMRAHVEQDPPSLSERRGERVDGAIEAMVARAIAKDPALRHPNAAAFIYELTTVMDMLDMGRRRPRSSATFRAVDPGAGGTAAAQLFEQSPFPQALVSLEGAILLANAAFAQIAGLSGDPIGRWLSETALAQAIPSLARTIERTPRTGRAVERRAFLPTGHEVVLWCGPTWDVDQVHVVIRVAPPTAPDGHRDSSEAMDRR